VLLGILVALVLLAAGMLLGIVAFGQEHPPPPLTSDVQLKWGESMGATGYKAYVGTLPGVYELKQGDDVGNVTHVAYYDLPRSCVQLYASLTAYNVAGESLHSDEVSFYSRPLIDPDEDAIGPLSEQVWKIDGTSFAPGVTLEINGEPIEIVRDSCERITFTTAAVPGTDPWTSIVVCNGTICSQPVPRPPGEFSAN
jgi:hypothetical protein